MSNSSALFSISGTVTEVESKRTTSGKHVVRMTIPHSTGPRDKEVTIWYSIVVWDKLADVCLEYVKKGKIISAWGELVFEQWDDKDGKTHYRQVLKARDVKFLSPRDAPKPNADSAPPGDDEIAF